jgi:predicted nucleotidyltransferase
MGLAVPRRVEAAVRALEGLARHEGYRAALLFGSLAWGVAKPVDVDALVVVDDDGALTRLREEARRVELWLLYRVAAGSIHRARAEAVKRN